MAKVLVVDRCAEFRQEVASFLNKRGYCPIHAANGNDGLRICIEHRPQAIVLGMCMQPVGGFDFLEELSKMPFYNADSFPKIIMTPEFSGMRHRLLADKYGVMKYMPKPINAGLVADAVRRLSPIRIS